MQALDKHHAWHTSAMQALALETLTLPSRLRRSQGINAATLGDLAVALDPSDERRIAQARFDVKDVHASGRGVGGTLSEAMPGCNLAPAAAEGDMRTFAAYEVSRSHKEEEAEEDEDQTKRIGHDESREGSYRRYVTSPSFTRSDSTKAALTSGD